MIIATDVDLVTAPAVAAAPIIPYIASSNNIISINKLH
jgi:hypothetical protein